MTTTNTNTKVNTKGTIKFTKKLVALLLAVITVFSLVCATAISAYAAEGESPYLLDEDDVWEYSPIINDIPYFKTV